MNKKIRTLLEMTTRNVREFDRINIKGKELSEGFSFNIENGMYYLIVDEEKDVFIYNVNGELVEIIFNKQEYMIFF